MLTGALFGFGAAMGVLTFLMVSDNAMSMYRWLRNRTYRLNRWRNSHGNEPGDNP